MFIVRTFVTKPAGTAWYKHDADTLGAETLAQWTAGQTSILRNRTRKVGKNKKVNTMVFADQAAYDAYKAAVEATPQWQARQAYFETTGFVVVTRKFQLIA